MRGKKYFQSYSRTLIVRKMKQSHAPLKVDDDDDDDDNY